jgi:hypothetical protein
VSFLQVKFVSLRRVAAGREPDLVVRLDSCEAANKLRGQFGRLVRGVRAGRPLPEYLKGVYLTNVATLSTRVRVGPAQGCQMVYFQTKNQSLGTFWIVLSLRCWCILWTFGLFYGHFI